MMPTSAQPMLEPAADAAAASVAEPSDGGFSPLCAELSNDFLNHYSEVLMLIEMAAYDPDTIADLMEWRPLGYRAYFAASELRRASAALAAYDALPDARREAFEKLIAGMDTLATMAVFALQPPNEPENVPLIVELTAPALRDLIAKAGAFLNSGGRELAPEEEGEGAQAVIDRILEHASARSLG